MLLSAIVEQVAMECDIAEVTIKQYKLAEKRFSDWLCRPAIESDLTHDNLNLFVANLQSQLAGTTARNYRVCITRIWNYISERYGYPGYDIKRIRRPKIDKKPVLSWAPCQINFLIQGASDLKGKLAIGIPQGDFVTALVYVSYDTGLRPVDLRLLKWESVSYASGVISIVQHKTRNPHTARICNETIEALKKIERPERDLVFPLTKSGIRRLELLLYASARHYGFMRRKGQGIGTIRKTHATAVYINDGEAAAAASLGHVGGVRTARSSYIDHRAVVSGRLPPSISDLQW